MKNITTLSFFTFLSASVFSQQWEGSLVSTGNVYRTGNVGVGITAPTAQFHAVSNGLTPLQLERSTTSQNNILKIGFTSNPISGLSFGNGSTIFQAINPLTTSDLVFINGNTSGSPRFVLKSNGNFGLGTDNPNEGLHLHGKSLKITGYSSNGQLLFGGSSETSSNWGVEYNTAFTGRFGLNFWRPAGSAGGFGNYILFLHDNGNVGIGTNNPKALFHVNGKCLIGDENTNMPGVYRLYVQGGILTEQVKIAVRNSINWADYVFEPNYQRMDLLELEKYVELNKHLPNIPSACEIQEDGIDVADLSNRLLEKIEELTLYIIEQEKKINELSLEIQKLAKD